MNTTSSKDIIKIAYILAFAYVASVFIPEIPEIINAIATAIRTIQ